MGRFPAGVELQAGDPDGELSHLSPERGPDRVANGQVHLPGDLRDRKTMRNPEVEADRQASARNRDAEAAGSLFDPAEDAIRPVAGEPGNPVRAERHPSNDVDHRAAGHERPPGDGLLRHRPSLLRRARRASDASLPAGASSRDGPGCVV
ncbi:MAG TPA: hypothetical protein VM451_07020 [Candidatus Limnocylindria bacterium]|nr:hypothetical protein [Candidatus Limnocylindria bacterium]